MCPRLLFYYYFISLFVAFFHSVYTCVCVLFTRPITLAHAITCSTSITFSFAITFAIFLLFALVLFLTFDLYLDFVLQLAPFLALTLALALFLFACNTCVCILHIYIRICVTSNSRPRELTLLLCYDVIFSLFSPFSLPLALIFTFVSNFKLSLSRSCSVPLRKNVSLFLFPIYCVSVSVS